MRSTLGIDTASPHGSIALAVDGSAAVEEALAPGGHSSGLAPAVARILAKEGTALGDLAGIAVSEGPGSFTGLRIGLAWAKGAAMARSVPLVLVPAHRASAHAHRHEAPFFATVTQGERGFVLAALWRGGEEPALLWGPEAAAEDDLLDRIRAAAEGGDPPVAAPTEALVALVEELGGSVLAPALLAGAIAEVGDREIRLGHAADLVSAAPAYGRAPNARRPAR
ncbi:MAG TPA: tRNA (adenosine(37)-N6)-threonylcarbamoyltransferase complex dimerization subunit type 1 TsaB [Candidatus Eisenbacteria bacterium]